MQRSIGPDGHVLNQQHSSHRNQTYFLDRLHCFQSTSDRKQVDLWQRGRRSRCCQSSTSGCNAFCLCMKYTFKLSLRPDSTRMAYFVSRILVTYATLSGPSTARHHLCDPNCDQPRHHTLRALRPHRPRLRSVQVRQHNWPASRRLARTVATLWCTHAAAQKRLVGNCSRSGTSSSQLSTSRAGLSPRRPSSWDVLQLCRLVFATSVVLPASSISTHLRSEGRNFDAVRHPPVTTDKKSLQSNWISTSSTHCGIFQWYCIRHTTPRWPRTCFSLGNKSHSACPEKARRSNKIGSTTSFCPDTARLQWLQTSFGCSAA